MGVSKNRGFSPQIIHLYRDFHYFHHPFWGAPDFGKHPYIFLIFTQKLGKWSNLTNTFFKPGVENAIPEVLARLLMSPWCSVNSEVVRITPICKPWSSAMAIWVRGPPTQVRGRKLTSPWFFLTTYIRPGMNPLKDRQDFWQKNYHFCTTRSSPRFWQKKNL